MARAASGVGLVARLIGQVLADWVAQSCAAQGLPVKLSDPDVLRQVGVLLGRPSLSCKTMQP